MTNHYADSREAGKYDAAERIRVKPGGERIAYDAAGNEHSLSNTGVGDEFAADPRGLGEKAHDPKIEIRSVRCHCGCESAFFAVFIDGKPVEFSYEEAWCHFAYEEEMKPFQEWIADHNAPNPRLL